MRNKWLKRFFPILALLLLAPWPVAYAHTYTDGMADIQLTLLITNAQRCNEAALLESMKAVQVNRTMMEMERPRLVNGTVDWSAFVSTSKVARYKLWQN